MRGPRLVATAAVLFALMSGLVGLDWGLPYKWHPDEKVVIALNMIARGSADPDYYVNPSLHLYLVTGAVWVAVHVSAMLPAFGERREGAFDLGMPFAPFRSARMVSVLAASMSVWLLWAGLRRDTGDWAAASAALALALSMGLMNFAHFATPESVLLLVTVASLGAFARLGGGRVHDAVVAGAAFGLACATKYTAIVLAAPLAWALLSLCRRRGIGIGLSRAMVAGVASLVMFFVAMPYALLHWSEFMTGGVLRTFSFGAPINALPVADRSWGAYAWHLANALGWPLFTASLAGLAVFLLGHARTAARGALAIHAIWIAVFWGVLGLSPTNTMRFIMPIVPSLAVFAGWGASRVMEIAAVRGGRRAALIPVVALYAFSAAYCLTGLLGVVRDARYAAGQWLRQHLVRGVGVTYFSLPYYLPYFDEPAYELHHVSEVWPSRDRDADFDEWRRQTFNTLNDVIVDSSLFYTRFFDDPDHWPGRARMYRDLLAGNDSAGYRLVAEFGRRMPWWFNPEPELVSPRMVIFAKPGQTTP